jgi:hypothetical protein
MTFTCIIAAVAADEEKTPTDPDLLAALASSRQQPPGRIWWGRWSPAERATYVAAIITVIGGLVAVFIQIVTTQHSPPPAQCSVAGSGNVVNCGDAALPRSLGRFTATPGDVSAAFFFGPVDELPLPTSFEGYRPDASCGQWPRWLTGVDKLYIVDPEIVLGLDAGANELVVVTAIDVTVLNRTKISRTGTFVRCSYGAGGRPGLFASVNTLTRTTTVREWDINRIIREFPMPPGSISQAEPGHLGVFLDIESMKGYAYEGYVSVKVSVNGVDQTYEVGTATAPLRWIVADGLQDPDGHYWGWNPKTGRWERDYVPSGGE